MTSWVKIEKRTNSWANRFLSYAGRLLLLQAIIASIDIYWSSHVYLPKQVIEKIEQLMRRFLWKGTQLSKYGAKVAWDDICKPEKEGGLGVKKISDYNAAMMLRYIWLLFTDEQNLGVQWIHAYHLRNKSFWELRSSHCCSWNQMHMLKARKIMRPQVFHLVGDGRSTRLLFDNWHSLGPLNLCL